MIRICRTLMRSVLGEPPGILKKSQVGSETVIMSYPPFPGARLWDPFQMAMNMDPNYLQVLAHRRIGKEVFTSPSPKWDVYQLHLNTRNRNTDMVVLVVGIWFVWQHQFFGWSFDVFGNRNCVGDSTLVWKVFSVTYRYWPILNYTSPTQNW